MFKELYESISTTRLLRGPTENCVFLKKESPFAWVYHIISHIKPFNYNASSTYYIYQTLVKPCKAYTKSIIRTQRAM